MTYAEWRNQAIGKHIDVDGAYGAQCVDVYLDYIQKVLGVSNWASVSGYGDAAQLFPKANPKYFTRLGPDGLPQQGDVIFYGGTATNPAGHVAIVDSANSQGVNVVEQDGFNPSGSAYTKFRPWNGRCIGWLRPNVTTVTPSGGGNNMFQNDAEVQEAYLLLRGDPGTAAERAGWIGQPKQRFFQVGKAEADGYRKQLADVKAALANEQAKPPKEIVKTVTQIIEKPVEKIVIKEVPAQVDEKAVVTNVLVRFWNSLFKKG